ncbi:phage tail-collar fiber domain-containing protein [Pseudomonas protegens]|uniref:phage tail-collar fiber domain-containing protein n=1 Tax=Pseudomonas protegens TaxID=380021 RepID=UPI00384B3387
MVNQNSIFGGMLTSLGAAKKTNCDALGIPWEPSYMLIGDANDTDPVPSPGQTQLIRQVYRAPLNALYVSPTDDKVLIAELVLPPEVGGWWIRELAIEDKDGVFCAVANVAPSYKPLLAQGSGRNQVVRMHIITNSTTNIQLKIDPSVVLATRSYVDQRILEELNKQDFKHSVLVATSGAITLSGLQTIDSVALAAGNRVLVKNQAQAKDNGLYVAATGAWSRTQDADTSLEVTPGLFVHVEKGAANGDSVWQLVTDAPIVLGTTDLAFEMVAGRTGVNAGTYTKVTVDKYGRVIAGVNPSTLAGYGITDTYTKPEIEALVAQASSLPVGSIVAFPNASVPPGFLEIDGSVKSIAAYPDLAAYLGSSFNKGDEGAGNFRLPESRGEFLRGWDHGRGVDAGRAIGSWQDSDNKAHTHGSTAGPGWKFLSSDAIGGAGLSGGSGSRVSYTAEVAVSGGSEARSRNLSVMWCIKAWNAPVNQGNIDIAALAALAAQATEINQGTAKIATLVQLSVGTDDTVIATPKKLRFGFALSLATNGYIAFPSWLGGLVIQWGYYAGSLDDLSAYVSFPMAFPTACLNVSATADGPQSGGSAFVGVGAQKDTALRFRLNGYGASMPSIGYHWWALGY